MACICSCATLGLRSPPSPDLRLVMPLMKISRKKYLSPPGTLRSWALGMCAALLLLGWPIRSYAQTVVATVTVGTTPVAVAVNPMTNLIYVANQDSNTVTVIDGVTNNTTTVVVGTLPDAVAVNTVTNKIYVTNGNSSNLTVIDGATNNTTTVIVGTSPVALAVNPATNRIYV